MADETRDQRDSEIPEDEEAGSGFRSRMVPDLVKKLLVAGVGALLTSEEGIRRLTSEYSLPKDVALYLISQGRATKNELFRLMAREFRDFLNSINLGQEITKALTTLTFEVKMQIRLLPSDKKGSVRPDIRGDLKVTKVDDEED